MNFKKIAAATLFAACAVGVSAKTVNVTAANNVGTVTTIAGSLDYTSDYLAGDGGAVTWTVPANTSKTVGTTTTVTKYYDVFNDAYNFNLADNEIVTANIQASNVQSYTLKNAELYLYEGTYTAGSSLSGYTLLDKIAYTTAGSELISTLDAGDYFYIVQGTTTGRLGGRYTFEVTAIPEPANAALLLAGLGLFGVVAKRRKIVG